MFLFEITTIVFSVEMAPSCSHRRNLKPGFSSAVMVMGWISFGEQCCPCVKQDYTLSLFDNIFFYGEVVFLWGLVI